MRQVDPLFQLLKQALDANAQLILAHYSVSSLNIVTLVRCLLLVITAAVLFFITSSSRQSYPRLHNRNLLS